MAKTRERNEALDFEPENRKFAIIGDKGIHEKCGDILWSDVAADLCRGMASGDFTASILGAVSAVGETLARQHVGNVNRQGLVPSPATNPWIASSLAMGHPSRVTNLIGGI